MLVYVPWYQSVRCSPNLSSRRRRPSGMFLVDPTLLSMRRMQSSCTQPQSTALLHRYRTPTLPLQINCCVNAASRRIY